ncbi:deaminase [Candidatus Falkowbacteria bacterium RIFOXYB2_FULL_34_18]|uniref:Deaminase n=1 Tax=Candidatus Falkowbacteria bacterium RIFOXYD2_FULL_34_120 TaxID=1798007 RepID=A0A1F5TNU4_9BACT|nr:MAG: deaminase [Candidatus Falkowbacteria bacterium RIFOXYB2_FULL_34_18]OGF28934.1 MAG: deaminase [Candidatus Falkowbacteria bacterium RIFOXYC12_FULL_34_55]OGF35867.1 MAG: deaminase [Candidatus Falkowbacteria bacterium RIFOXYC2_FULL_34_220]OGF38474.1 MAG: deaminase [Candidatus Falkowbacteria bacterium RIFOXYD12_FULL_34_57]OGF40540.1 MAG: deaminase [Candidatus Falkowbacteria bacterium RIFOXYD2_FULL_34_120]
MIKPITTLFMLQSVDGKISTGDIDKRDFDRDLPKIKEVKNGLHQYYDIEKTTDMFSLNTGRVMAKIGVNTKKSEPNKMPCSFIIIDNKPHLNARGINYLTKWTKKLYLVTSNKNHPAFKLSHLKDLEIIHYPKKIDLKDLFAKLKTDYKVKRLTIQSGGTLNAEFVRLGLVDYLSVVVAPCLVGGKDTSTLIDGKSLRRSEELKYIKAMNLKECKIFKNSYLHLTYKLIND